MGRGAATAEVVSAPRRRGRPTIWTDERIEEKLRVLVDANGGRFPTRVQLETRGFHGLRNALKRKGVRFWAERLGVGLAAGQDRETYGIEEARLDIDRVVAEVGRLPGQVALRKLGYGRLATLVTRFGGSAKFCAAHGIELSSKG
jgi:hypothetical protein